MLVSNHWTKSRFGVGLVNRFGDEELKANLSLPTGIHVKCLNNKRVSLVLV